MLPAEIWVSIAAQIPVTLAFIWFSLESQKRNQESADRRDAAYEKRNEAIVNALNANTLQLAKLTDRITEHDARIDGGR